MFSRQYSGLGRVTDVGGHPRPGQGLERGRIALVRARGGDPQLGVHPRDAAHARAACRDEMDWTDLVSGLDIDGVEQGHEFLTFAWSSSASARTYAY